MNLNVDYKAVVIKIRHAVLKIFEQLNTKFLSDFLAFSEQNREKPTTDALSQIDYGHTRHCEDCKEVCLCQRTTQRAF